MRDIRSDFGRIDFTPQEQEELIARLKRAAEEEETMTDATKRNIKRISRGMVLGIAAACLMTAGALAAALNPGLRGYFAGATPEKQQVVEQGIQSMNHYLIYNGWTMTLDECIGDETSVFLWITLTAPQGTSLAVPEGGGFDVWFRIPFDKMPEAWSGAQIQGGYCPDEDPDDNQISFCCQISTSQGVRGETISLRLESIQAYTWGEGEDGRKEMVFLPQLTKGIADHQWVFEDVVLDYPDQTVVLEPDVQVPYLDGTATLTQVRLSPLNVSLYLEGGSCGDFEQYYTRPQNITENDRYSTGDATVDMGSGRVEENEPRPKNPEITLTMKDGSVFTPQGLYGHNWDDGITYDERGNILQVEEASAVYTVQHAVKNNDPNRILDPAQVASITINGVTLALPETPEG